MLRGGSKGSKTCAPTGWQLGEFSSTGGVFFCTRGAERCQVGVEAADPGRPVGFGAAHLTESPGRDA
jgi:hypothetical protein